MNRAPDSKTADIDFDVIGEHGRTATDFNLVGLVIDHAAFILNSKRIRFPLKVNRHVSDKTVTALHFLEVDMVDTTADRIALDILNQRECGLALLVGQLNKSGTAADPTVEVAKINCRDSDRASFALSVEGRRNFTFRAEAACDATARIFAVYDIKFELLHD